MRFLGLVLMIACSNPAAPEFADVEVPQTSAVVSLTPRSVDACILEELVSLRRQCYERYPLEFCIYIQDSNDLSEADVKKCYAKALEN